MEFTEGTTSPLSIKLMPWGEIFLRYFDTSKPFRVINNTRKEYGSAVLIASNYAIKVMRIDDPDVEGEIQVGYTLTSLLKDKTPIFNATYGYILSTPELPPNVIPMKPTLSPTHHLVYVFLEQSDFSFDKLSDNPKTNQDFYFEVLIGLYFARQALKFSHRDIQTDNLMFQQLPAPTTRKYNLDRGLVIEITSDIVPKVIDFGQAVMDVDYQDGVDDEEYKQFWDLSDVRELSLVFRNRKGTNKFKQLVNDTFNKIELKPRRRGVDSAANTQIIVDLLKAFYY